MHHMKYLNLKQVINSNILIGEFLYLKRKRAGNNVLINM